MRLRTIAVAAATGLVVALAPTTAHAAKPAYKVSISLSKTTADVGQTVTVSGKVAGPKSAKKKLLVQRKVGSGAWKTVKKVKTTKKSRYSTKVKVSTAGKQSVRVVALKSSKRVKGVSKAKSYTGYRWLDLTVQKRQDSGGGVTKGAVTLDGTTYAKAFTFSGAGTYFHFAKKCTTVRLGLGAQAGATGTSLLLMKMNEISSSGTPPVQTSTNITAGTAPQTKDFSVAGFAFTAFGSGGSGQIVTVNPVARCAANSLPAMPALEM